MKIKKILFSFLVVMFVAIFTVSSNAYSLQAYGYPTVYIPIKSAVSSEYTNAVKNAVAAWNNAIPITTGKKNKVKTLFYFDNKASNVIYSQERSESWVGAYSYYTKKGKTYKFNIYLNDRLLKNKSENYKQSVAVHELGHALSLNDNPPETQSIMRYDRNRNIMIVPQPDDIAGVKKQYGLD